jgi:LAO/AO transport system kinase
MKAGILEIADIFAVNKADLPGAAKVYRNLRDLVRQTKSGAAWQPPVILTSAQTGAGIDELLEAIERHFAELAASGELEKRRRDRVRAEVEAIVVERAAERARRALREGTIQSELAADFRDIDPYALAERILNGHNPGPGD